MLAILLLPLFLPLRPQIHQLNCDHAAPPRGMHYVCKRESPCDCRLEPSPDDEDERQVSDEAASSTPAAESLSGNAVKYFVMPTYPLTALRVRRQGAVEARILIDAAGEIEQIKIESGDPLLAHSVSETLSKWKFRSTGTEHSLPMSVSFVLDTAPPSPKEDPNITVAGSSLLNLVITANASAIP